MLIYEMIKKLHFLIGLTLILFFPLKNFSQSNAYYKTIEEDLIVRTVIYHNVIKLNIEELDKKELINYSSNNSINVGLGVTHSKIPFGISIGYSIGNALDRDYLKTESTDFQLHWYRQKYVIDIFYQNYKGFYIEDTELNFDQANIPDLSVSTTGIVGQYIFNANKFSYRAAFNQKEKQIKSAGSFLLGGGVYFFHLKSTDLSVLKNEKSLKSFQMGINAGYSYNWVINSDWLINSSLTLGANIEKENPNAGNICDRLSIKPASLVRLSCFYNSQKWSMGISGVINMVALTYTKDLERKLMFGRFNITYLRRFSFKNKN